MSEAEKTHRVKIIDAVADMVGGEDAEDLAGDLARLDDFEMIEKARREMGVSALADLIRLHRHDREMDVDDATVTVILRRGSSQWTSSRTASLESLSEIGACMALAGVAKAAAAGTVTKMNRSINGGQS